MSIIKGTTNAAQLALIGGAAYLAYRAYKGLQAAPSVTETAHKAWWQSSFGDLTMKATQAYGDFAEFDFGKSWSYQYTSESPAERLQKRFELGSYPSL